MPDLRRKASLMPHTPAALPYPEGLVRVSAAELMNHRVAINVDRWHQALAEHCLPPAAALAGLPDPNGVTRAQVFVAGDAEITEQAALQLLYLTLAWGLGRKTPRLNQRLEALAEALPEATTQLTKAWRAVREGCAPEACYRVLVREGGGGVIPRLGPAFATKFLYFANGTATQPAALILDRVVATRLRNLGWPTMPVTGWWPSTYQRYCDLLRGWAEVAAVAMGSPVRSDQVEMSLFTS